MSFRPVDASRRRALPPEKTSVVEVLERRLLLNALLFSPQTTLAAANHPQSLVIADINGDNKPDLIVANEVNNSLSIFLGNGDGSFAPATKIKVGNQPDAVLVGDVNNDGNADLIVANYTDHTVSVLLGNGHGQFSAPIVTSIPGGLSHGAEPIALADINGDGKLDLITANGFTGTISVLLGNGDGTFAAPIDTALSGAEPNAFSVAAGKFTASGFTDVVVTNPSRSEIDILFGNGTGHFAAPQTMVTGSYPSAIAVADLRGDGKQDIVVTNKYAGTDTIFLGNGDGTFASHSFSAGNLPFSSTIADVNGDGKLDIVTVDTGDSSVSNDAVSVLPGNGDGTFGAPQMLSVGNYPVSVAAADLNGDGNVDLVSANAQDDTLSVLLNAGPVISYYSGVVSVTGTSGADTASLAISGGSVVVTIDGQVRSYSGDQVALVSVRLLAGNDSLAIGPNVPPVFASGGMGSDTITANNNAGDTLHGNKKPDLLSSTSDGNNILVGGPRNDTLVAGLGDDMLIGSIGADSILGSGFGGDTVFGDTDISGGPGNDTIQAGPGDNTIHGNGGNDSLVGGIGDSFINGNSGDDTILGSTELDTGIDTIYGGGGNDSIADTGDGDLVSHGQA